MSEAKPETVKAAPLDYESLGRLALGREDFHEAASIFRRALERKKSASAFIGLGRAFRGMGDLPAARWAFYRALDLAPGNDEAKKNIVAVEAERIRTPLAPARTRKSVFRAGRDRLEIYSGGQWRPFFIKGVNLGLGLPGHFPGEFAIRKAAYLKWFRLMAEMGANAVRVYTVHPPCFYEALHEFNGRSASRLYLLQGIWTELPGDYDFSSAGYAAGVKAEIRKAVDAVFGNAEVPEKPGQAHGSYTHDVSAYTAGFIFGREWESCAVKAYNGLKGRKAADFKGRHLRASGASPFELWVAGMCDYIQGYEDRGYGVTHPVSATNWPTLDPLGHPSESDYEDQLRMQGLTLRTEACNENEDMESLDSAKFSAVRGAGYFATYHAYPYYPDFMNNDYLDADNTYLAYLRELKRHHGGQPVFIGEFGVPSSREVSHWHRDGWHHGGHGERRQGEVDGVLMRSIFQAGAAGGAVFSWFDEWYKRNWLFLPYELPADRNRLWFSLQDAEQNYGFLAAYPGYPGPRVTLSGDRSEWGGAASLYEKNTGPAFSFGDGADDARALARLMAQHDEGFLYILLETRGKVDFTRACYMIGIDTCSPEAGEFLLPFGTNLRSPVGLKFLVHLAGRERSRMLACMRYDKYLNAPRGLIAPGRSDQGAWVVMQNKANARRISKNGRDFYPSRVFSMSGLRFGSLRAGSPHHDSLADFYVSGNMIEVRIPWSLMNFTDPSSKTVLWKEGAAATRKTDGVRLVAVSYKPVPGGLHAVGTGRGSNAADHLPGRLTHPGDLATYEWDEWETPVYHMYVKESYGVFRESLSAIPGGAS
ncbi:MAG: hypothetical protein Kow0025_15440 [Thermodesulfovibrionales bacterium]